MHSGQSLPFIVFHWKTKSSAVIGVPSFQTASGRIWYTMVCGLVLVCSAETRKFSLSTCFRSGVVVKVQGRNVLTAMPLSKTLPSEEFTFQFGMFFSIANVREPPCCSCAAGTALQVLGLAPQSSKTPPSEASPSPSPPPPPPQAASTSVATAAIAASDAPLDLLIG